MLCDRLGTAAAEVDCEAPTMTNENLLTFGLVPFVELETHRESYLFGA
eukprot:SAG31_NODE_44831_length_261_cov_0.641975_1_plen_47_part_10